MKTSESARPADWDGGDLVGVIAPTSHEIRMQVVAAWDAGDLDGAWGLYQEELRILETVAHQAHVLADKRLGDAYHRGESIRYDRVYRRAARSLRGRTTVRRVVTRRPRTTRRARVTATRGSPSASSPSGPSASRRLLRVLRGAL